MRESYKLILLIVGFSFLFFGCINLETDTNGPDTKNESNDTEVGTSIVISGQENNSVQGGGIQTEPEKENDPYEFNPESGINMYFINVESGTKQGESIFVKKGQYEILVDTGPAEKVEDVVNFVKGKIEGNLEVLVLTHDDVNHWGGAKTILDEFVVEEIWWNGDSYSDGYDEVIAYAEEMGVKLKQVKSGDVFNVNGAAALVMNPPEEKFAKPDTDSIAIRFEFKEFCAILLSDTVYGAQANMVEEYKNNFQCDVMHVPYSGLGTGNTYLNFLMLHMQPKHAIMTGSKNIENPSNNVLRDPTYQQLEWANVDLYKTFEGGTVKVSTNGADYTVSYIE